MIKLLMKRLSLLLLLSSCVSTIPPRSITTERCSPYIEAMSEFENRWTGYCRCHQYKMGDEIKKVSDSYDKPLNYCSGVIGFKKYVKEVGANDLDEYILVKIGQKICQKVDKWEI